MRNCAPDGSVEFVIPSDLNEARQLQEIIEKQLEQCHYEDKEIFGIRLALGATPRQIVRPILRTAVLLAAAGFVVGLPLTLALTGFIRANLYGVTASDPVTVTGASILLVVVMLVAAWIPARRATKVDPIIALRCE